MKRRDLRLLVLALVLLALPVAWVWWSSRDVEQRREATLAGVPQFPAPHQAPRRKPFPVAAPARPQEAPRPPPVAAGKHDPMASFVLGSAQGAALVQVNALFNTPLFERLRQCLPAQFGALDQLGRKLGVDLAYDVDRVALIPGGVALSGFFEGKPVAESMMGPGASVENYRSGVIFVSRGRCAGQLGNLVVTSDGGDCRALLDRSLAPTPANASDQLYGDIYARSDLAPYRAADAPAEVRALLDGLDGLTLRANVWDSVALSVEGQPSAGHDARDLMQMARGAIALAKGQLDEDQVELQTLAGFAKVSSESGKLELNLALPAQDLFDKLHLPCPGRDGGP